MPVAVPRMPWPRLKWPVPRVRSATTSGTMTANTAAVTPSRSCTARSSDGSRHRGEQKAADRQRGEADQQQRPAAPDLRAPADPRRQRRDEKLRHDDAGRDDDRRPMRRAHGDDAAHQRQHGRIGEVKQQQAAGEDEKRPIVHQRARLDRRLDRLCGRGGAPCARSGSISLPEIERSAISAGTSNSTVTMNTARAESR